MKNCQRLRIFQREMEICTFQSWPLLRSVADRQSSNVVSVLKAQCVANTGELCLFQLELPSRQT